MLKNINPTTPLEHELLKKLSITEEKFFNTKVQLKKMETQFDEYRNIVKESLYDVYSDDKRWALKRNLMIKHSKRQK